MRNDLSCFDAPKHPLWMHDLARVAWFDLLEQGLALCSPKIGADNVGRLGGQEEVTDEMGQAIVVAKV